MSIERTQDIAARAFELYRTGWRRGDSTGWRSLDRLWSVDTKQWTVVTGVPGSGKSEWLDALMVNLAEAKGWDFAVFSPENFPTESHLAKLAEKHIRKPFRRGQTERMTRQELAQGIEWIADHFAWLDPEQPSLDAVLDAALSLRRGQRRFGVIVDPWNTLEHQRPGGMTETEYVSASLTRITNWVRMHDAHLFMVAHPSKIGRDAKGNRPVPTPYDIAGSAHWYNKADNCVTIDRQQGSDDPHRVEVHVQKVRFKNIGHVGVASLLWDPITGRFNDAPQLEALPGGRSILPPERDDDDQPKEILI